MKLRRILSFCLAAAMLCPLIQPSAKAATYTDINGHWAKNEITVWSDMGIINGYGNVFRPKNPITRAEMATIFNRIMKYTTKGKGSFTDLPANMWFADAMLLANGAGLILGDDKNRIRPTDYVTREEAAVIFCRALGVTPRSGYSPFKDYNQIASWAREYVTALVNRGYIQGFEDGTFRPKSRITRAEIVKLLSKSLTAIYSKSGTYSFTSNANVVINSTNTSFKNLTVYGNLIISEGVGNGDVMLENINVRGDVIVRGGGKNTIYLNGATIGGSIVSAKTSGDVRIVVSGDFNIPTAKLLYGTTLEMQNVVNNRTITNVDIPIDANTSQNYILKGGVFNVVTNYAPGTKIEASGNIKHLILNHKTTVTGTSVIDKITSGTGAESIVNGQPITGNQNLKANITLIKATTAAGSGGYVELPIYNKDTSLPTVYTTLGGKSSAAVTTANTRNIKLDLELKNVANNAPYKIEHKTYSSGDYAEVPLPSGAAKVSGGKLSVQLSLDTKSRLGAHYFRITIGSNDIELLVNLSDFVPIGTSVLLTQTSDTTFRAVALDSEKSPLPSQPNFDWVAVASPVDKGVHIASGVLTVPSTYVGSITVSANVASPSIRSNTIVKKYDAVPTTLKIEGADFMEKPDARATTSKYTVGVYDQAGKLINSLQSGIVLTIDPAVEHVTIDSKTGTVTVAPAVSVKQFTIRAISGSMVTRKTVDIGLDKWLERNEAIAVINSAPEINQNSTTQQIDAAINFAIPLFTVRNCEVLGLDKSLYDKLVAIGNNPIYHREVVKSVLFGRNLYDNKAYTLDETGKNTLASNFNRVVKQQWANYHVDIAEKAFSAVTLAPTYRIGFQNNVLSMAKSQLDTLSNTSDILTPQERDTLKDFMRGGSVTIDGTPINLYPAFRASIDTLGIVNHHDATGKDKNGDALGTITVGGETQADQTIANQTTEIDTIFALNFNYSGTAGEVKKVTKRIPIPPKTYSVTLSNNGGSGALATLPRNEYLLGDIVVLPKHETESTYPKNRNPKEITKTGYTFAGWNTSINSTTDFSPISPDTEYVYRVPATNIVFYAVWIKNIIESPKSAEWLTGSTVNLTFTVKPADLNSLPIEFIWEASNSGTAEWTKITDGLSADKITYAGAGTTTLTVDLSQFNAQQNKYYRCRVKIGDGYDDYATSDVATLTIKGK